MSYNKTLNPFEDDEDDGYTKSRSRNYPREQAPSADDRRGQIMEQIDESERRQLDSTMRALASIDDSERMGIATGEELLRQGEQLDNIERKTTKINQDLKTSEKYLTNIKSVFGGIKNWWRGDKDKDEPRPPPGKDKPSALRETMEQQQASGVHPMERLRTEDGRGFYEDDDLDDKFLSTGRRGKPAQSSQPSGFQSVTQSEKEHALNRNLDMMSDGMARLKGLAVGLGDEISTQNEQLERITTSTDRADTKITHQNRQMRNILK